MSYITTDHWYVFDSDFPDEDVRLALGEAVWDGDTIARLTELGVGAGWSCLELGAGRGSIARWLAERVGPQGAVVATDLRADRLAADLHGTSVVVERHDLNADPLPEEHFDLIHARLVLQHLPERRRIVARLARALRPAGVLLLEDTDVASLFSHPAEADFQGRVKEAAYRVMRDAGYDPRCGLRNLDLVTEAGLVEPAAQGRAHVIRGGSPAAQWYALWLGHLRPEMTGRGYVSPAEVDAAVTALADPRHIWLSQVMVSVSAVRPG
jgi:SAM-dependent methyltransferase